MRRIVTKSPPLTGSEAQGVRPGVSERQADHDATPPSWSAGRMTGEQTDRPTRIKCLGEALKANGWRLAVAESCTGGLLAASLTEQAGTSGWFEGGWVTYSNRAKQRELNVPAALFAEVGAVSREVVAAMAEGALDRAGVEYAVAISGVAGPGGGSDAKPVGTVWLGWAHRRPIEADGSGGGRTTAFAARFRFPGDRHAVREAAVDVALRGLCAHLGGQEWEAAAAAEWSSAFWPVASLKV